MSCPGLLPAPPFQSLLLIRVIPCRRPCTKSVFSSESFHRPFAGQNPEAHPSGSETPQVFHQQLPPPRSSLRRGRLTQVEVVLVVVITVGPGSPLVEVHAHAQALPLPHQKQVIVALLPDGPEA